MPIYDYKCPDCKRTEDNVFLHSYKDKHKCVQCQADMKRLFSVNSNIAAHVFPAAGIFLEHVSAEGKLFHSKNEMRNYEKKHDITIGMLH